MISTFCPGWTRSTPHKPCRALSADTGTTAACAKEMLTGLRASLSARATVYSAKEPWPSPRSSASDWSRSSALSAPAISNGLPTSSTPAPSPRSSTAPTRWTACPTPCTTSKPGQRAERSPSPSDPPRPAGPSDSTRSQFVWLQRVNSASSQHIHDLSTVAQPTDPGKWQNQRQIRGRPKLCQNRTLTLARPGQTAVYRATGRAAGRPDLDSPQSEGDPWAASKDP